MSELIDRKAFIEKERKLYCEDCDRRKGTKNGKPNVICYEIGEAPCRACWLDDALGDLEDFPAAPRWHRVSDGLPKDGQCCLFFTVESGIPERDAWFGIYRNDWEGDINMRFDYWMPIEPPKEDA